MRWFMNLSTRAKLHGCFGVLIVLLVAVATTGYRSVVEVQASQKQFYEENFADVMDVKDIRALQITNRAELVAATGRTGAGEAALAESAVRSRGQRIEEALARLLRRHRDDPGLLQKLQDFQALRKESLQTRESETYPLLRAGRMDEARRLLVGVQAQRDARLEAIADDIVADAEREARTALELSDRAAGESARVFLVLGVVAVLAALGMTLALTRALSDPLKEVSAAAERVAAGDLTVALRGEARADETGVLRQTFDRMISSLREVTREIREGVNVLAASASEITAATTQVAAGSAETATAVSQTTSTVEEVKQTAVLSTQKARYVSEVAQKTAQISQSGKKSVDEWSEAMQRIRDQVESIAESIVRLSEQGQAIGEIIATVNDLAEQSNLLAVNASIEAAKAGEQGKGFAVVAQEVRSLAEQSKQATAQVRSILGDIQKATASAVMATEQGSRSVEAGVKLSGQVGESIRVLAESIGEAAQAAMQIAASAQQQLAGMDQVALAMQNVNQASAQNVASTKQTESAAQSLHELGQKLKRLVERYQV